MGDSERFICCDLCSMWLEFEKSGITCSFGEASVDSFAFICQKCTRLRILEFRLASVGLLDVSVQAGIDSVDVCCQAFDDASA